MLIDGLLFKIVSLFINSNLLLFWYSNGLNWMPLHWELRETFWLKLQTKTSKLQKHAKNVNDGK